MTGTPQRAFRASALDRAASPEQFDHLVVITKPSDWILTAVLCLALTAAIIWGVVGRIPTRVTGDGILISNGDRVVDAVSGAAGRLALVFVTVGDHVVRANEGSCMFVPPGTPLTATVAAGQWDIAALKAPLALEVAGAEVSAGAMTDARWADFYNSMTDVGVLPAGLDPRQAYTLEFVNKGIGK